MDPAVGFEVAGLPVYRDPRRLADNGFLRVGAVPRALVEGDQRRHRLWSVSGHEQVGRDALPYLERHRLWRFNVVLDLPFLIVKQRPLPQDLQVERHRIRKRCLTEVLEQLPSKLFSCGHVRLRALMMMIG